MIESIGGLTGLSGMAPSLPLRPPQGGGPAAQGSAAGQPDFAAALKAAADRAVNTLQTAETVSMQAMLGEANIQQVVDKVMEAERTLSTALAIRNKLIAAWQEISRMQI